MQEKISRQERKQFPFKLNDTDMALFERIIERRALCNKGKLVCQPGDHLSSLYIVLSGSFKAYTHFEEGQEQANSFYKPGSIIGLDGIGQSKHREFIVALENSEICEVPLDKLDALSVRIPTLRKQFVSVLSDSIHNR